MTTVFLVRHGRSHANTAGILAGWSPEVHLDEVGLAQVGSLATRLAALRLSGIVASPLERTVETAEAILDAQGPSCEIAIDARVGECRYGDWTGRRIADLTKEPLWRTVQDHPSSVTFPGEGGESMVSMQARAVEAVRDYNDRFGARGRYVVVSHGDVIKAILADALGMHLDHFQRIAIDPASVSIVDYGPRRPHVLRVNDSGSEVTSAVGHRRSRRSAETLGGGSGESP